MARSITRKELKDKIADNDDFILIEVLKPEHYRKMHLPGAINIPIDEGLFEENVEKLVPNKEKTVVLYCWDRECNLSSRAAQKMENMGYANVLEYVEGKKAWKDAGLKTIGDSRAA